MGYGRDEDPEVETDMVLVLGNAMDTGRVIDFFFDGGDYPRLGEDFAVFDEGDGTVLELNADGTLTVDIPAYTIAVLRLQEIGRAHV